MNFKRATHIAVSPSFVKGEITVPSSKSLMQRAFAAALLHVGTTIIRHVGMSEDDEAALKVIAALGAKVRVENATTIQINSKGLQPQTSTIHCGESGLSARVFTFIAALSNQKITLTGTGSLMRRPMLFFEEILPQLEVKIFDFNGQLPITLQGKLLPKNISIDSGVSSQFLSGLLFAFSDAATDRCCIEVKNLNSKPYIDLTLQVLAHFGKKVSHEAYKRFYIEPKTTAPSVVEISIEADWSSVAYWIVGGLLNGSVFLEGLTENSFQADKILLDVATQCGGQYEFNDGILHVKKAAVLNSFDFDATNSPDLFPILAVLAACCEGVSSIKGLHRLKHKESDREESIKNMLYQLAVPFKVVNDTLEITGVKTFPATTVHSHQDHRIAMAAAIAALRSSGKIIIEQASCVSKSYPDFFKHYQQLTTNTTIELL